MVGRFFQVDRDVEVGLNFAREYTGGRNNIPDGQFRQARLKGPNWFQYFKDSEDCAKVITLVNPLKASYSFS